MSKFERLFGVKSTQIKQKCILAPFISKGALGAFGINQFEKGILYSVGSNDDFTLIRTPMHPGLVGDAVLYLKDAACKQVILFGSCGLAAKGARLDVGSIVAPVKSYSLESFSEMLSAKRILRISHSADAKFLENLINFSGTSIQKVVCQTVSSLKIEEDRLSLFVKLGIQVFDMESSAFFSAAHHARLNSLACFYVSDIVREKPFYDISPEQKIQAEQAEIKLSHLLCTFLKNQPSF